MLTLGALLLPLAMAAHPPVDSSRVIRAEPPRFALVLSGGLARGLAHIGVLRALEEERIRPDIIVGTSMGALVGALWAGGRSSHAIQRQFKKADIQALFEPHPRESGWRGDASPDPWVTFFSQGLFRLPPGMLDDAFLNDLLVRTLLDCEGMAQGDFDRLPVQWRAVATDLKERVPVVLARGSVARAVRSSASMPIVLPAISHDSLLIGDGGIAADLPIAIARDLGSAHILGIDVALPSGVLEDRTPALAMAMHMLRKLSASGQRDARPDVDRVVWLKMPGFSAADFRLVDTLAAMGYRESKATIAQVARDWDLKRYDDDRPVAALPPLTRVGFFDQHGKPARFSRAGARLFGSLPAGPLITDTLGSRLARIYRGDLFQSAWPHFRSDGRATTLAMEVREHPAVELTAAGGFERDRGGRIALNVVTRPLAWPMPPVVLAGGAYGRYRRSVHGALEPRSLARGASGPFVRASARRTETRLFDAERQAVLIGTERVEAMAGLQARVQHLGLFKAGVGHSRVWERGRTREGPMAAATLEAPGRFTRRLDLFGMGGEDRYGTLEMRASMEFPTTRISLRPGVMAAWATDEAPLDELPGVGGPRTLMGFRRDEWLGKRALAAELRAVRHLYSGIDVDAYVQTAHVAGAVSRMDLEDRLHIAAGMGFRAAMPFGPLELDLGLGERGIRRFDLSFGQEF